MNYLQKRNIPYKLFILLLTLDAVIMLLQKKATNVSHGENLTFYMSLLQQPWTWFGLMLSPVQLFVWTKILGSTELSIAYPISSLSYPITIFAAQLVLHEHVSLQIWAGALLITFGVAIIGSIKNKSGVEPGLQSKSDLQYL